MTDEPADRQPAQDPLARVVADTFRKSRGEGLSIEATSQAIAAAMRRRLDQELAEDHADAGILQMQSIVSGSTGQPYVQCQLAGHRWQWPIDDARQHALAVLETAEAAAHDAAAYRFFVEGPIKMDANTAAHTIGALREFRGDQPQRENWRPTEAPTEAPTETGVLD